MKSQPPFGYVHRRLPIGESDANGNGGSTGTTGSGGVGPTLGGLAFDSATYSVAEDGGSVTVVVNRIGTYNGACSVHYATSNGTATAGVDYTAASGDLTWLDGDSTSREIEVEILDDGSAEPSQTFNVTLSSPIGTVVLSIPFAAVVTITDDDPANWILGTGPYDDGLSASLNSVASNGSVFVAVGQSNITGGVAVARSTDGITFVDVDVTGVTEFASGTGDWIVFGASLWSMAFRDGSGQVGFATSADAGTTWVIRYTGLGSAVIEAMIAENGVVMALVQGVIKRSVDDGATYANYTIPGLGSSGGFHTSALCYGGGNTFAGIAITGIMQQFNAITSTDNGATWSVVGLFDDGATPSSALIHKDSLYAGAMTQGAGQGEIFRSANLSAWTLARASDGGYLRAGIVADGNGYMGGYTVGSAALCLISSDLVSWTDDDISCLTAHLVIGFAAKSGIIVAISADGLFAHKVLL